MYTQIAFKCQVYLLFINSKVIACVLDEHVVLHKTSRIEQQVNSLPWCQFSLWWRLVNTRNTFGNSLCTCTIPWHAAVQFASRHHREVHSYVSLQFYSSHCSRVLPLKVGMCYRWRQMKQAVDGWDVSATWWAAHEVNCEQWRQYLMRQFSGWSEKYVRERTSIRCWLAITGTQTSHCQCPMLVISSRCCIFSYISRTYHFSQGWGTTWVVCIRLTDTVQIVLVHVCQFKTTGEAAPLPDRSMYMSSTLTFAFLWPAMQAVLTSSIAQKARKHGKCFPPAASLPAPMTVVSTQCLLGHYASSSRSSQPVIDLLTFIA